MLTLHKIRRASIGHQRWRFYCLRVAVVRQRPRPIRTKRYTVNIGSRDGGGDGAGGDGGGGGGDEDVCGGGDGDWSAVAKLAFFRPATTSSASIRFPLIVLPWDISQKGIILSSMFWGYVIPQIPAGHLSRIIGTKYLLFWAMMLCSITTILGPYTAVNFNWLVFCFCRSLQGLGQGFFYPCVNAHISKWAPPSERNRMLGCVYGGGQLGSTLPLFLAGYLSASPWGWPSIFYVTGACGVFWSLTWLYVGADCPNSHSTIGDNERAYIKSTIKNCSDRSKEMRTPWRQIITSLPVLPLLLYNFGQLWCYSTMVTMLPLYYRHVLHFDIEEIQFVFRIA
ncbi:hypothetical protein J6590_067902 [Homalodisca vitripennis]|nr:hypothetical protein J6590_067902 [Homalodisca vitripennis]